jgi:exodeoxyribonuclease VII large subunit
VRRAVTQRVAAEQSGLHHLRSRPVLAAPATMLDQRHDEVVAACARARTALSARLDRAADSVTHLAAQVRALSPAATLERGYAVVQRDDGAVVRSPDDVRPGDHLRLRVAQGDVSATVDG